MPCGSFATGFFLGPLACLLYLFGYQAIDTGIQLVGLAAFARYFVLQSALLLLQIGNEGAFLFLLRLQFSLFGFTLLQQTFLSLLHLFQLGLLGSNLLLLFLNFFALQTLVGGILAHVCARFSAEKMNISFSSTERFLYR